MNWNVKGLYLEEEENRFGITPIFDNYENDDDDNNNNKNKQ